MSILSSLLRDVAALFFPPRCPVCGRMLAQGEHTVCTLCRATAPLTGVWRQADNPVLGRCRDMLPVERASGLLYYVHGSGWRELIRGFKYRGAWRTARAMGEWYGRCLKESGLYDDVEVVVPLPLHPVKRCRRGYNQSEYIAEGIAAQLGVEVDRRSVRRKRNTESQALKARRDRARNVEDAFAVGRPGRLAGRHVNVFCGVQGRATKTCFNPADDFLQLRPELCFSLTVQAGHGRFDLRHQFKGFPAITEFYFGAVRGKISFPVILPALVVDTGPLRNFPP